MNSSIYLSLFLITACIILILKVYHAVKLSKRNRIQTIRGREFLPLNNNEELLEIIANKYDVFISDLPRNRNLQREAVKYIIKHANEYSRKEIIKALDYLYSWEK